MKRPPVSALILAATAALAMPPFLLIPLVYHLPMAQLFKDFYEASLWLSPAVGIAVLYMLFRSGGRDLVQPRQPARFIAAFLAGLDLLSPVFFYVLLAVLGGH